MNANWNRPVEELDTTEKQGDLLAALSGQHVTVHTNEEPDFDYMENEDVAFVVQNPHGAEDLLIELCGEFSVFFEKWHGEYKATEQSYEQMKQDIADILAGKAGALSLYTDDAWRGTTFCPEKPGADADAAALLDRCWKADKPRAGLQSGGRVELVYWDPAENRSFVLPAQSVE